MWIASPRVDGELCVVAPGDELAQRRRGRSPSRRRRCRRSGAATPASTSASACAEVVGLDAPGALDLRRVAADVLRSAAAGSRSCALYVSASPKLCHMSPYWATSFSVTFWPLPPIRIGSLPSGGGLSLPMRSLIRGRSRLERAQAVRRGAELVAVLVVVALEPAGADAEDRAAAGDVVDRAVRVGEQLRVAVGVADHQRADLRALGHLGHRAERRDRLEVLAVRRRRRADRSGPSRRSSRRRAPRPRARRGACRRSRRAGAGPGHLRESKPFPHLETGGLTRARSFARRARGSRLR